MPSPLLTVADYPEVRAALDVTLSAKMVPDAILALPIYVPAACRDVLDVDPDAESRTGTEGERVHAAAIYFAGYRLSAAVDAIVREAFGDVSVQRPEVDYGARGDDLLLMARAELAAVLGPEPAPGASIPIFQMAPAGRPLPLSGRSRIGVGW